MKLQRFIKQSEIAAPTEVVFAWHEQPDAVEQLTPPWEHIEVLERPAPQAGLQVGTKVIFKVFIGPFWRLWVAEHIAYKPPHLFADIQLRGPFAYWRHNHRFESTERGTTRMTDEVEYALPLGWLGELVAGDFTREKLRRMFDYRHQVLAEKLNAI